MASSISDQGFFTSGGVIKSDGLRSSTTPAPQQTNTADTGTAVADQVARNTASAISEAAVVKITNQLNVGDTGFDSGVAANVQEAVMSALNKVSANTQGSNGTSMTRLPIGGTYQNELIAAANKPAETAKPPEASAKPAVPPGEDIRELAKKYVDKQGKNMSKEERDKKVDEVAKFYSDPSRQGRLKKLVDEQA